jgi:hypothetical protein
LGRLLAACGIAAILSMAVSPDRAVASTTVSDDYFGISAPNFFLMSQKGQTGVLDSYLTNIRESGIDWVRDAAPWPDAEPARRSAACTPTGGAPSTPR